MNMKKEFTSKQKEIIARKLGYDGPMQGFDEFVASSPALSARYNMVTDKYVERMAKGGLTRKKFAEGGVLQGDPNADLSNAGQVNPAVPYTPIGGGTPPEAVSSPPLALPHNRAGWISWGPLTF